MRYEIKGEPLPVVIVYLEAGESIKCEKGAMSWMTPNMKMETGAGGVGKAFSRMFSGESIFQNTYTAVGGQGMIAFASSFPGSIIPIDVSKGDFIVQKSGYLASEPSVELSIAFQRSSALDSSAARALSCRSFMELVWRSSKSTATLLSTSCRQVSRCLLTPVIWLLCQAPAQLISRP